MPASLPRMKFPAQEVNGMGRLGVVVGLGLVLAIMVWMFFFSR